jgi:hypothetical protein
MFLVRWLSVGSSSCFAQGETGKPALLELRNAQAGTEPGSTCASASSQAAPPNRDTAAGFSAQKQYAVMGQKTAIRSGPALFCSPPSPPTCGRVAQRRRSEYFHGDA